MSTCARCGAQFSCAMVDADASAPAQPCWCTCLPAALPVPSAPGASCWCPDCLKRHIAQAAQAAQAAEAAQAADADPAVLPPDSGLPDRPV